MQRTLTLIAMLSCIAGASAQPARATDAATDAAKDASSWPPVASVLRHPRCMNCHPAGDFPRQGDDRHRHQQLVMRGAANSGVPTLQCAACHQSQNSADGHVPGAPKWHLAPLGVAWENLNDPQLCTALKDRANPDAPGGAVRPASDPTLLVDLARSAQKRLVISRAARWVQISPRCARVWFNQTRPRIERTGSTTCVVRPPWG